MRFLKIAAAIWALFVAVLVTAAALSESFTPGSFQPSSRAPVVTVSREVGMLDGDIRMLERMRVTAHSSMNTMIEADPMWVDSDMIRAQEQYQSQIDRMLARG